MSDGPDVPKPVIRILGGGPSGLAAAFSLTSPRFNPDWKSRYDVVVHQLGWRLGGKGATGRNAAADNRVEEHGIHLFGNMYTNSLHMLFETLTELNDGRTIETELLPSDLQVISDFSGGRWHSYYGGLPHNGEEPWLNGTIANVANLEEEMLSTVKGILSTQELPVPGGAATDARPSWLQSAIHFIAHFGSPTLNHALQDLMRDVDAAIAKEHTFDPASLLVWMQKMLELVRHSMSEIEKGHDRLHFIYLQLDLLATVLHSVVHDELIAKGIDSIDHLDYRQWLAANGASPELMSSSLPEMIPNICMQYTNGDTTTKPRMAASAYVTFVLRQVLAPGDCAYFFRVSTGDTVILPLYQVLLARGVRFEFFNKVTDLVPSADGTRIDSITLELQATAKDGAYRPIATLPDGQLGWPSVADFDQLQEGVSLQAGAVNLESWWTDWKGTMTTIPVNAGDQVIVALPPQAQRYSCVSAVAAKAPWQAMIDHVPTTATQSLQIWLDQPLSALGWPSQKGTNRWMGPTYTNPINAIADFSDTIKAELWPADSAPKGLMYFCGPMQDAADLPPFDQHDFPATQTQRVRDMAAQYLHQMGGLLPGADDGQGDVDSLDFALLHCAPGSTAVGENRVDEQYYRANIDPNERYTVSAPDGLQYRLRSWQSGYNNCALSSDAIYTGFNIGSFEGAVMAGLLASLTITGSPTVPEIYGYDFLHPGEVGPGKPLLAERTIDLRAYDIAEAAEGSRIH